MRIILVSEKIKALHEVWLLGDNFAATTYRKFFLLRPEIKDEDGHDPVEPFEFFIKKNFDFNMFCNSRFNSPTQNMLVRIQNTFVSAINKAANLPKYIILIFDNDLIEYMNYLDSGMAQLLGVWVNWLISEFAAAVEKRNDQLPVRAKLMPCIYWCLLPGHVNFYALVNENRKKFNFCVESSVKGKADMRVIKIKDNWDFNDPNLVQNGSFTEAGKYAYWEAVDAAFHFNADRHELFLAKSKCSAASSKAQSRNDVALVKNPRNDMRRNESSQEELVHEDGMRDFFRNHRTDDRFHWSKQRCDNYSFSSQNFDHGGGNRFMLPRLICFRFPIYFYIHFAVMTFHANKYLNFRYIVFNLCLREMLQSKS